MRAEPSRVINSNLVLKSPDVPWLSLEVLYVVDFPRPELGTAQHCGLVCLHQISALKSRKAILEVSIGSVSVLIESH